MNNTRNPPKRKGNIPLMGAEHKLAVMNMHQTGTNKQ